MITGTINNTLKAKNPTKTTAEDSVKTKGPIWKKEDLGTQIRSFEYQISGIMEKVVSYES